MPISQLLIMPMMFLSGSLFPIAGLPAWLAVLTRLNPLTYVVQPMRHFTLDQPVPDGGRAGAAAAVITWFGWQCRSASSCCAVVVITLGLVSLAARILQHDGVARPGGDGGGRRGRRERRGMGHLGP